MFCLRTVLCTLLLLGTVGIYAIESSGVKAIVDGTTAPYNNDGQQQYTSIQPIDGYVEGSTAAYDNDDDGQQPRLSIDKDIEGNTPYLYDEEQPPSHNQTEVTCQDCTRRGGIWCKSTAMALSPTDGVCLASKRYDCELQNKVTKPWMCPLGVQQSYWGVFNFVVVTLSSWWVGVAFRACQLPVITGYLFMGVLAGPYLANIVTYQTVSFIGATVQHFALAFISLSAGLEIYYPDLRDLFGCLTSQVLAIFSVTLMGVATCTYILSSPQLPIIGFMSDESSVCRIGMSLLAGVLMVAPSPASALAVVGELRARGPLTKLLIGTTVLCDVVVVVSFAIILPITASLCSTRPFDWSSMVMLFFTLVCCLVLGLLICNVMLGILWLPPWKKGRTSWFGVPSQVKGASIMLVSWLFFEFSHWLRGNAEEKFGHAFNLEPILVLMIASSLAGNRSANRKKFANILHKASSYIFLPFFTITGVSFDLQALRSTYYIAIIWWLLRMFFRLIASYPCGRWINGLPPSQYKWLWMTTLAQAGVTLGLSNEIMERFYSSWGVEFNATIVAVVILNQISGPIMCKIGIKKSGEAEKIRPVHIKLVGASELARDVAIEVLEHGGYVTVVPVDGLMNNSGATGAPSAEDMLSFWTRQQQENLYVYGNRFIIGAQDARLHISDLIGSSLRDSELYWQSLTVPSDSRILEPVLANNCDSLVLLLSDVYNVMLCKIFSKECQRIKSQREAATRTRKRARAVTEQTKLYEGEEKNQEDPVLIALMVDPSKSGDYIACGAIMVNPYPEMIAYLALTPHLHINQQHVGTTLESLSRPIDTPRDRLTRSSSSAALYPNAAFGYISAEDASDIARSPVPPVLSRPLLSLEDAEQYGNNGVSVFGSPRMGYRHSPRDN